MKQTKTVEAYHNQRANTLFITVNQAEILPEYLKYLLEHLKIPADVTVIFQDSPNKPAWVQAIIADLANAKEAH